MSEYDNWPGCMSFITEFIANIGEIIAELAVSLALFYAWAAIWFLLLRYLRPETPERQRRFLKFHYEFFTQSSFVRHDDRTATLESVQNGTKIAWVMFGVTGPHLMFHPSLGRFLFCCIGAGLSGWIFACSWYGQRCLRMLQVESYKGSIANQSGLRGESGSGVV